MLEVLGFDPAAEGEAGAVVVLRRAEDGTTTVVEGDRLSFDDVLRAVKALRRNEARPADEGHYVAFVGARQRGALLGMMLVDAWEANLGRRWAAEERAARSRSGS
jgi:hypothetical protein